MTTKDKQDSQHILVEIWRGLIDLVYPPKCLVCGDMQATYLCASCYADIERIKPPCCPRCAMPTPEGPCRECPGVDFSFDSATAAGVYSGVLKDAIHQLKYSGHRVMAPYLYELLVELLRSRNVLLQKIDCIVPVPIHPKRQRERGFNQSELLARGVGRALAIPVLSNAIRKSRLTPRQVELTGSLRREIVVGAFEVVRVDGFAGRRVLLIDDVFTTGSTCDAAASALRSGGAREIHVLTVARSV